MRAKRVLLDVDGVLADFHQHTLDFLRERWGLEYEVEHFPTWDIFATVGREYEEETLRHWAKEGWCAGIPLYAGAQEGVEALRATGAEVYFVTAQMTHSRHWMWERVQWLKQHFGADDPHVVFTLSKYLVAGDVLVDDKPSNVTAWVRDHAAGRGVLWDQPTNTQVDVPDRVSRCGSWHEVVRLVASQP